MTDSYDIRIENLFSRHASVASAGFSSASYKPGLDAQRRLDHALGSPSRSFRSIHVAGTNGKGSVCSFLASALAAAGFRVGLYTSPHLVDFRERIKVISRTSSCLGDSPLEGESFESLFSCEMISREGVSEFLDLYDADLDGLTFFEVTTGMAFWWFARQGVDFAVIETGLGGRLDSTNIIVPEVSVVTSIGLDHCALLGDTRAAIAGEKAGIFKPGVPAVVGVRDDETSPVFEACAAQLGCPLHFADESRFVEGSQAGEGICSGECSGFDFRCYNLDLKGPCQDLNLRTALTALSLLRDSSLFFEHAEAHSSGRCATIGKPLEFCRRALENAASLTGFHGRWEYVRDNVICDIGHNPPALKENFARLEALGRPMVIVYGIMADKDLDGIAPLMPSGAQYVLTAPATPRALSASDLFARLSALRPDLTLTMVPDVPSALALAKTLAQGPAGDITTNASSPQEPGALVQCPPASSPAPIVYVGGSTYVVSEAIKALG